MTQKQRWIVIGVCGLLLLLGIGGFILRQKTAQPEESRITETDKAQEKSDLTVSGEGIRGEDSTSGIGQMPDRTPAMAEDKEEKQIQAEQDQKQEDKTGKKQDGKGKFTRSKKSDKKTDKKGTGSTKKQPSDKKGGGGLTVADPTNEEPSVDLGGGDNTSDTDKKEDSEAKPTAIPTATRKPTSTAEPKPTPEEELWGPVF